jgi:hypothetical protein
VFKQALRVEDVWSGGITAALDGDGLVLPPGRLAPTKYPLILGGYHWFVGGGVELRDDFDMVLRVKIAVCPCIRTK